MMNKLKTAAAGLLAALVITGAAYASGLYTNGLPASPTPLTGLEQIPVDTQLPYSPQTAFITTGALQNDVQYNTASNTTAFTATTAQLTGKSLVILDLTGTLGGAAALTTPTAALLIPAYPLMSSGSYILRIIDRNSATNSWTLTGGTGVTVTGGTVTFATYRDYVVTSPTSTTVTMTSIGAGTN